MDIFNSVENGVKPYKNRPGAAKQRKDEREPAKPVAAKKRLSDQEVREKLRARMEGAKVDLSKKAKNHPAKSKVTAPQEDAVKAEGSDLHATKKRLRKVLETGGFQFDDKERGILEEIINRS